MLLRLVYTTAASCLLYWATAISENLGSTCRSSARQNGLELVLLPLSSSARTHHGDILQVCRDVEIHTCDQVPASDCRCTDLRVSTTLAMPTHLEHPVVALDSVAAGTWCRADGATLAAAWRRRL